MVYSISDIRSSVDVSFQRNAATSRRWASGPFVGSCCRRSWLGRVLLLRGTGTGDSYQLSDPVMHLLKLGTHLLVHPVIECMRLALEHGDEAARLGPGSSQLTTFACLLSVKF